MLASPRRIAFGETPPLNAILAVRKLPCWSSGHGLVALSEHSSAVNAGASGGANRQGA